ncbi:hypothetical protein HG535_0E02050 [Zygotorulaspora mrakii]|uniref:CNH domain-containing protein n=1 Tax=Zygotorulaspora mrakii TaxID=42260 RepID=A0A7H9B386_ZYGMR|nr:uncharacterized protein HG535_0E02050 [Zygotorulaspora mrakii]QLG73121.1 hypothetical protein HG535_0E02050 [Zygotorulaspora mrakii]
MNENGSNYNARFSAPLKREIIPLPKLPPLNTTGATFKERSKSHRSSTELPIGWTPVSGHDQSLSYVSEQEHTSSGTTLSSRYEQPDLYVTSPSSSARMRPPPPPPPQPRNRQILNELSTVPRSTPHTPPRFGTTLGKSSPNASYSSPFVGEAEIEQGFQKEGVNSRVYRSPFIGDPDLSIVRGSAKDNGVKTKTSNESMPYISFDNTAYHTRALPPLPTPDGRKSATTDFLELYNLPPPTLHNKTRDVSNHSRVSDSIDSYYSDTNYAFNNSEARHSSFNSFLGGKPLEQAPSITAPTQPFSIDSLDENKLYQCYSVYRLSDIYEWVLKVYFEWFNECVFGKIEFFQMVQLLLEFQLPKSFDQDTIDSNVDRIIESLVTQKAVRFEPDNDEEITIIVAGLNTSGIFTELLPCYSFIDANYGSTDFTLCYSLTCVNRLPSENRQEIKLSELIDKSVGVWADYWKLTPEEIADINPREVQRQSFIFDLIILEERSLNMANAAVEIYGKRYDPELLPNEPDFAKNAFDIFEPMIHLHKEYLLSPILWKLKTRGKFIDGIGKIYLKWCNEAHDLYLNYACSMAKVHDIITWEKRHNTRFAQWLRDVDNSPEISRSKMYHDVIFFGGFFKSLQNLPITLNSILKNTERSSEDYAYLELLIAQIENLSVEVDRAHGDAVDKQKLMRFSEQLVFRNSGGSNTVGYVNLATKDHEEAERLKQDRLDLGLRDPHRRLIYSGIVMKRRELWVDYSQVYIVLLDNYFLITEIVNKGDQKRYKLAERPIPIDYLSLEQRKIQDIPQSATGSQRDSMIRFGKASSLTPLSAVRPQLKSSTIMVARPTSAFDALASTGTEISNETSSSAEFSFKIRNTATNESFTFYLNSSEDCQRWTSAIMNCFKVSSDHKSKVGLDLQVLSTEFSYSEKDAPVNLPVAPEGSDIDIALKHYEIEMNDLNSVVNTWPTTIFCSSYFEFEGQSFLLVATDYGVLLRREGNGASRLIRVLQTNDVRQIEVNSNLGLVFVLDNRILCYFNIASIVGAYFNPGKYLKHNRIVGVILRDKVRCFKFAEDFGNSRHLFFERKGKIFVLTPEFDRLTKILQFFKVYKVYKLPVFNNGLNIPEIDDIVIFKKCFVACTSKGAFLYHDSFNDDGITLPSFLNDHAMSSYMRHPHLSSNPFRTAVESSSKKDSSIQKMAEYVKKDVATNKTKPITCFQLKGTTEFLLIYDEAVVKIDCHGQISDWKQDILVLDFYCTGASYHMGYLTLIGDNLVQVYNLMQPKQVLGNLVPIQIIKGKKVKLLSCSQNHATVIALSHPNIANRQLLLACIPKASSLSMSM